MAFEAMKLPYHTRALEPHISKKTLEFHYEKHYKNYVSKVNELTLGTRFENLSLENVILENFESENPLYHNASQAWNHAFFWSCLSPKRTHPSEAAHDAIQNHFGSLQKFKELFISAGTNLFGSGWIWIAKKSDGTLSIEALENSGSPLTHGKIPLLVCDVWEHAYYLDYQNDRLKYLNAFWTLLNWDFLEKNLKAKPGPNEQQKNLRPEKWHIISDPGHNLH